MHSAFSLFTMSSRSEGTSISLLEAMSAGLPSVVTNVGGNAAVLGTALLHRAVPTDDPQALAASWGELLKQREMGKREGALARARVIDAFGLDAMVRAYERLYRGESIRSRISGSTKTQLQAPKESARARTTKADGTIDDGVACSQQTAADAPHDTSAQQ